MYYINNMSSIFSDIEVSNMSLLTYGAIGITSIVLAVVTIFDKEGGPEMASVAEPEISPSESSVSGLFSNNEKPEEASASILPEVFSNTDVQEEGDSEQNIVDKTDNVVDESQELQNENHQSENEGQQDEENTQALLGGKKRKSTTKKYGKSREKKQRKRMTKTRTK